MGQFKSGDTVLVAGYAPKDAELKQIGEKQTPLCEFSLVIGKQEDGRGIFANCKAWRDLAGYASRIKKGDSVCVVGKLESREYNGKTYSSVVADWLNITEPGTAQAAPAISSGFEELPDGDGELPF